MNEADIAEIERALKIIVPAPYKALMLERSDELQKLKRFDNSQSPLFGEDLFFKPRQVIQTNLDCRNEDDEGDVADFFPRWWETFFMVGTNGAGDYRCLRLDNQPGVWLIGTDCGDEPQLVEQSFAEYVDAPVEFNRRGFRYGDFMPLPQPVLPQASAESLLEQSILGHWVCVRNQDYGNEVYFKIGGVALGSPPPKGETEEHDIREAIATFEACLRDKPMHLESGLWKQRLEYWQGRLKALESGEPPAPVRPGIVHEVQDMSDAENWIRLRYQFENGGGGDWHLQFDPGRDELTWTRKAYYQTTFSEPARWTRVKRLSV